MADNDQHTHAVHSLFVRAASAPERTAPRAGSSAQGSPPPGCPASLGTTTGEASTRAGDSASSCPASADARHAARINMPVVPNAAGLQGPALPTTRQASSIPMGAEEAPQHQQGEASTSGSSSGVWMYPSEQQFYNAMKRKGWDPDARDMSTVVAIHNSVNERTWQQVMLWERLHECECAQPRLKMFQGRPNDYSPKARLLNLLGYKLPFDRHDWVVDRCGRDVRYVIDFYSGAAQPGAPASMYLDVRPALDSLGAVWDRARMQWGWVASSRWQNGR